MEQLYYFCSQHGCKRKYKTAVKWVKHLTNDHGVENPALPDQIPYNRNDKGNKSNQIKPNNNEAVKRALRQRELEDEAIREAESRLAEKYGDDYIKQQEEKLKIQEETKLIQQRVKDNPDDCCICYDESPDTAVVPCGHAYFCYKCILNQKLNYSDKGCPFCRGPIDSLLKLYM